MGCTFVPDFLGTVCPSCMVTCFLKFVTPVVVFLREVLRQPLWVYVGLMCFAPTPNLLVGDVGEGCVIRYWTGRATCLNWTTTLLLNIPSTSVFIGSHDDSRSRADLHICIGTSLQMYPAASLPLLPRRSSTSASACNKIRKCDPENNLSSHRSKLVIINLQKTKLSKRANLNIHAPADVVLDAIAKKFHLAISSTVPSSDIFVPMLLLRSVHSTPTDSIPWRVFPHPTAGSLVQILESLVSPKTEAIHSSTDPVRKPTGNAEGHDPKGSIKVTDQNLGISDLKVESTAKTSV
ncbi:NAD-dependent protein deacetylase sirtuin-6, variant 2 [Clonorchis sinensis]|uniref:NAD-dependent protein deacetylase sirtuin-6, variant 2 n=1 Tax=Clonorchis sinensis TaxID=79923 RepID=A0A8T1MQH0_CLOSI|nr:NAD-dependent protein deacetylase sirtuin-6, variant 2 [Clonorchis sinensis]